MKRRVIPFGFAAAVLAVCLSPLLIAVDPNTADLYTLPVASAIFAFMAGMFWWMRRRMVTDPRRLTVFGVSLVDFFTALTLFAGALAGVYVLIFYLAVHDDRVTTTVRTLNRAAIIAGGALIVGTGAAVSFEMRRAGPLLSVHREPDPWDGTTDRRIGPKDRRQAGGTP